MLPLFVLQPPSAPLGLLSGFGVHSQALPLPRISLSLGIALTILVSVEKKGGRCASFPRDFHPVDRTPWPAWQADEIFPNSLSNAETTALHYHTEKQQQQQQKTNLKTQQIDLAISASNLFIRETAISHTADELLA